MTGVTDKIADFLRALDDPDAVAPEAVAPEFRTRFRIHRNNVGHGRVEALRATFPVVERLVGARFFVGMARAYVDAHPPASPLLFRCGGGFADFIAAFPPASGVPYLADVARIEWLRLQAYHAEDVAPTDIAALARVPENRLPGLVLKTHPSLGCVRSRWPACSIWAASIEPEAEVPVDLDEAQSVAILRPSLAVEMHLLPAGGGVFLAELAAGTALGRAADSAAYAAPGFDLSRHLQVAFDIGAVVALEPAAA